MSPAQLLDISTPEGLADAFINHAITAGDLHGITADELEAVYSRAYDFLGEGDYQQALDDLAFLVKHEPSDRRYQFSFALCLHHLRQYEDAANHYAQAMLMNATDAVCALRMGECLAALGHLPEAREAFESVVKLSYLETRYADARALAQQRLDALTAAGC
jgi:type III secretion system low calcium response chaperone LcrH/SycD